MATPTATWDATSEGVSLANTWDALRTAYLTQMPAHIQSLSTLAVRPITG